MHPTVYDFAIFALDEVTSSAYKNWNQLLGSIRSWDELLKASFSPKPALYYQ